MRMTDDKLGELSDNPPLKAGRARLSRPDILLVVARVREETKRFRAVLPELCTKHSGQWVVFRDGKVHSLHSNPDKAFRAGLDAFGREGGQVIAQIIELPPTSAGIALYLAS